MIDVEINFFDSNCSLGPHRAPPVGAPVSPEALVSEMEISGIDRALVYHTFAAYSDPRRGKPAVAGSDIKIPKFDTMLGRSARGDRRTPPGLVACKRNARLGSQGR